MNPPGLASQPGVSARGREQGRCPARSFGNRWAVLAPLARSERSTGETPSGTVVFEVACFGCKRMGRLPTVRPVPGTVAVMLECVPGTGPSCGYAALTIFRLSQQQWPTECGKPSGPPAQAPPWPSPTLRWGGNKISLPSDALLAGEGIRRDISAEVSPFLLGRGFSWADFRLFLWGSAVDNGGR